MEYLCDVLIVGAGLAGINTALELDSNLNIIIISNDKLDKCNSYLAQGGITSVLDENDLELFISDTMKAASYTNDEKVVRMIGENASKSIEKLISYGVEFNRDENGKLKYTREAAHSSNRILYANDTTGKEIWEKLLIELKTRKNIKLIENLSLIDLIEENNKALGAIGIKENRDIFTFYYKKIVMACGGIGGLFKASTNYDNIKGIGLAIAFKYNIKLKNIDCIQLHPTAFYSTCERRRFLLTESLRGEGAKIIDDLGEQFIDELMPRDIVSKGILEHKKKRQIPCVLLDARHMGKSYIINRFPKIYYYLMEQGIDISQEAVPVAPCQHYFMGGIEVDLWGRSSMKNLYACGEVSCTGLHGNNRLASNSLLEASVFSLKVAENINNTISEELIKKLPRKKIDLENLEKENIINLIRELEKTREDLKDELLDYR